MNIVEKYSDYNKIIFAIFHFINRKAQRCALLPLC